MSDFTKLAAFLDSVVEGDPNYDYVCYIKEKLAEDQSDPFTINNTEDAELEDPEVTTATPEQQTEDNLEGKMMEGAFQELEALNQIEKEEQQVNAPDANTIQAAPIDFGNDSLKQKSAESNSEAISLYDALRLRLIKSSEKVVK